MKLSTILAIAAVSEAQRKKPKVKTAETEANKLKKLIDFVWDKWYQNCNYRVGGKADKPRQKYKELVDRMVAWREQSSCAAEPAARRRRDLSVAELCINDDGENTCERINKGDRSKAVKQLGNLVERWGENWISEDCARGLTRTKISNKAQRWRDNLETKVACHKKDHALKKHYKNKAENSE